MFLALLDLFEVPLPCSKISPINLASTVLLSLMGMMAKTTIIVVINQNHPSVEFDLTALNTAEHVAPRLHNFVSYCDQGEEWRFCGELFDFQ